MTAPSDITYPETASSKPLVLREGMWKRFPASWWIVGIPLPKAAASGQVAGQVSPQVGEQVGEQVLSMLRAVTTTPRTKRELLEVAGLADAYLNYKRHILPLLESGLIERTPPRQTQQPPPEIPAHRKRPSDGGRGEGTGMKNSHEGTKTRRKVKNVGSPFHADAGAAENRTAMTGH